MKFGGKSDKSGSFAKVAELEFDLAKKTIYIALKANSDPISSLNCFAIKCMFEILTIIVAGGL